MLKIKEKVFKLTKQIPLGKITTYKWISFKLFNHFYGSRIVGKILKNCFCKNNFDFFKNQSTVYKCDNYCYRVIRSNFHVGKLIILKNNQFINDSNLKLKKLFLEKVFFNKKGILPIKERNKKFFKDFNEINTLTYLQNKKINDINFFYKDAIILAKKLLNKILVRKINSKIYKFKIIETEAYIGPKDDASHSYKNKLTLRNKAMFSRGGTIYIYFIYGKYYCLNIVANIKNKPEAVLIRAVEPLFKHTWIKIQTNGPGKLCRYLKIDKTFNNSSILNNKELWLEHEDKNNLKKNEKIISSKRINIDYAKKFKDKPWRFYLHGNLFLSRKH